MAVFSYGRVLLSFDCRSDTQFCGNPRMNKPGGGWIANKSKLVPVHSSLDASVLLAGLSFKKIVLPLNFDRQLSVKARRRRSNISVRLLVATSCWNNPAAVSVSDNEVDVLDTARDEMEVLEWGCSSIGGVQPSGFPDLKASFLSSDGSIAVHAGERFGRGIDTDAITTPVINASAYFFKNTADVIEFKEGRLKRRHERFEYARYGNPTTVVAEEKISALEGAESTLLMASGMCASAVMMLALVPAGGHVLTTSDCYRKTKKFIESILPKLGISATVIDPADMDALKCALDENDVTLFFTESPTNPYLRCIDIELVSKLCHSRGALVCIDGSFATPLNQKALALGADIVLHSATKFIAGHNDVLGGCISGSKDLISTVRTMHHIFGGVLNPNAAYLIIRGMKTLHLRVREQNSTAMRMAEILEAHPKVSRVHYPGLPSHPDHHIANRQMTGFGGVVSFEIDGDLIATSRFIDALKIPYIAPSFGGCESIVDQRAVMSYWDLSPSERGKLGIKDNLVRFSFGVEDFEDLKVDILQALETV